MAVERVCSRCGRIGCVEHTPKPWASKQGRGNRMRSGSREQRVNRGVMAAHDGVCHVCGKHGADQIDHVVPLAEGGADGPENRRPIHSVPCHRAKSAAEAAKARNG